MSIASEEVGTAGSLGGRALDQLAPEPLRDAGLHATAPTAMEAVILAGGKGLRLRPYTTIIPKPLVPIGEHHSVLEVVLRQLAGQKFARATLTLGYMAQLVEAYAGDGSQWGIEVCYARESSPLGTLGPVVSVLDRLPDHFVVANADVLTSLNYSDLLRRHLQDGAQLTVATQRRDHHVDFGVLNITDSHVMGFSEKPRISYSVNMGIYAVSRRVLERYEAGVHLGFDQLIQDLLSRGEYPSIYEFDGYWLDIGRPEDYDRANQEFAGLEQIFLPDAR